MRARPPGAGAAGEPLADRGGAGPGARAAWDTNYWDTKQIRRDAALRPIERLLDDGPLLSPDVLELCRWAAAHYLYPLGPAIKAALPPGIDLRERLAAQLTGKGRAFLSLEDAQEREAAAQLGGLADRAPAGAGEPEIDGARRGGGRARAR